MTDAPSPRPRRSALSPATRSLRLQRIFARLQDGASCANIAAEEGFSRERLRQIVRVATAGSRLRRPGPQADPDRPPDAGFAPRRGRRR